MAIAFEAGSVANLTGATSQSVTLPATTQAGDCIVVTFALTVNSTVSGAGAIWFQPVKNYGASSPEVNVWIGYNATAGATSITVTQSTAANTIIGIAMFSGVGAGYPLVVAPVDANGTTWPVATSSVSYNSGDLLVACAYQKQSATTLTPTWSDGSTNNNVGTDKWSNPGFSASLDYVIESAASSTSVSYSGSASTQGSVVLLQFRASGSSYTALDAAVLTLSPTFYLPMEETAGAPDAVDISGNNNFGTYTAADITLANAGIVPSDAATCADQTGTSAGLTNTFKPSIASSVQVSVMAVAKWPTVPTSGTTQILNNLSGTTTGMSLRVNSTGNVLWVLANGSTDATITSASALTAGHPYLIVGTYNYSTTTMSLYLYDLTAQSEQTVNTATLAAGSFSPSINWTNNTSSASFPYYVGRLGFIESCLTSAQVAGLYVAALMSIKNYGPVFTTTCHRASNY